ncbi:unnamed protein product [Adineta steineri]|uniref:Uncharacterized protein n=1 Tax=Adineta steineri TaxID=433720 RepID=A0A814T6C3_9BILA|nr:unnamed protein product [Adineta steineri]CAF3976186.1 unnamed protein product [Adineta steineri]
MNTTSILCYIVFIILSITVQIESQICEKKPQYGECSINSACGCFRLMGVNNNTGICGFRWPTCSRLVLCNSLDNSCSQSNTTCVQHPQCNDLPLCYPVTMTSQSICPPMKNEVNSKWKQNGIIIAGGNANGNHPNQFAFPTGIFIDDENTIYIADSYNDRIVEWKFNSKNGHVIAGENGRGNGSDQFNSPMNMIFDKQNNSLIICDQGNRRIIQWFYQSGTKQQILISNIDCYGLAIDKNGFIYISDNKKDEVRQWKEGDVNGRIVAGGNGKGKQLNQFNSPTYIFIDEDSSLYITDYWNHRVMKWRKDAKEGIVVAGGNDGGENLNQLRFPQGVIVDHLGQIYVVDGLNNRVMRWYEGKEEGEIVVGGNGEGSQLNQLNHPTSLSFDAEQNIYVVDSYNQRVQKYLIDI